MTPSFKVALVGPSRVGKTTLLTAILDETKRMLAGTGVAVSLDEVSGRRVRHQRQQLRQALRAGEFNSQALAGNQDEYYYYITLQSVADETARIPFTLLDFPGKWLDPDYLDQVADGRRKWAECLEHIKSSVMLLVPIDAAVLMEAATPPQRAAVEMLLGFGDVEDVARSWAQIRNLEENRSEPAVLVLAPLKCERYFDDNGGYGKEADELRRRVADWYGNLITIVREEAADREIRIVYAPVDTYGVVELMEAYWQDKGQGYLDFTANYRVRGNPSGASVKAAGAIMQELCQCLVEGWDVVEGRSEEQLRSEYRRLVRRDQDRKGFWGTLGYYLSGEASENQTGQNKTAQEIATVERRRRELRESVEKLAADSYDPRVELWA